MAQWQKNFTPADNVNSGQEFGVNDYPTTAGFNVPINNSQYLHDNCVGTYAQNFNSTQKAQARTNIGAGTPITVDSSLGNSTNPIQNQAVNTAINDINQRLTDLGFKEGSFTIQHASSITATTNVIKKQGKRCISNLVVNCDPTGYTNVILSMGDDYKPSSNTQIFIKQEYDNGRTYYTQETVTTNGTITINLLHYGMEVDFTILNSGWEL